MVSERKPKKVYRRSEMGDQEKVSRAGDICGAEAVNSPCTCKKYTRA